ncbi:MAG: hypothetical protein ACPIOQ_38245 [Promethearchaeia archaeon]
MLTDSAWTAASTARRLLDAPADVSEHAAASDEWLELGTSSATIKRDSDPESEADDKPRVSLLPWGRAWVDAAVEQGPGVPDPAFNAAQTLYDHSVHPGHHVRREGRGQIVQGPRSPRDGAAGRRDGGLHRTWYMEPPCPYTHPSPSVCAGTRAHAGADTR